MKEYPDYKYRPRRKPKTLRKEGYPYSIPYPSVPMDAFRTGESIFLLNVINSHPYLYIYKKKRNINFLNLLLKFTLKISYIFYFNFSNFTNFTFVNLFLVSALVLPNTNFQKFLFYRSIYYHFILREAIFPLTIHLKKGKEDLSIASHPLIFTDRKKKERDLSRSARNYPFSKLSLPLLAFPEETMQLR